MSNNFNKLKLILRKTLFFITLLVFIIKFFPNLDNLKNQYQNEKNNQNFRKEFTLELLKQRSDLNLLSKDYRTDLKFELKNASTKRTYSEEFITKLGSNTLTAYCKLIYRKSEYDNSFFNINIVTFLPNNSASKHVLSHQYSIEDCNRN